VPGNVQARAMCSHSHKSLFALTHNNKVHGRLHTGEGKDFFKFSLQVKGILLALIKNASGFVLKINIQQVSNLTFHLEKLLQPSGTKRIIS
jgi:hypothetical protein